MRLGPEALEEDGGVEYVAAEAASLGGHGVKLLKDSQLRREHPQALGDAAHPK